MTAGRIRAASPADLPRLQEIERAAGERFRDVGMDLVADDEPLPLAVLRELRRREVEYGLDRWPRGCWRREVTGAARRSR